MTARRSYILTNKYIPTTTKTDLKRYDWDLNTWFNELKFKEATGNPDQYFSNVKLVNFGIIYNDMWKSQLQKPFVEDQALHKSDFNRYDQKRKGKMPSAAYRSERKDVFFLKKNLDRKYFFEKYPHVSAMKKKRFRKKQPTNVKLYFFNFFFSKMT